MNLLRVYFDPQEIGPDGYPKWWHKPPSRRVSIGDFGYEDVPLSDLAIKDLIRQRDGQRCLRCLHPYFKGKHMMETAYDEEGLPYNVMWTPCDEQCRHFGPRRVRRQDGGWINYNAPDTLELEVAPEGFGPLEIEASWRILTVHHLNGVKHDCRWWNLVSLCQRCHLTIQAKVFMDRPWDKPHSEWFKPFAAGFYAWKYLDQEPTQEEVMERLDELLDLELRQDALF